MEHRSRPSCSRSDSHDRRGHASARSGRGDRSRSRSQRSERRSRDRSRTSRDRVVERRQRRPSAERTRRSRSRSRSRSHSRSRSRSRSRRSRRDEQRSARAEDDAATVPPRETLDRANMDVSADESDGSERSKDTHSQRREKPAKKSSERQRRKRSRSVSSSDSESSSSSSDSDSDDGRRRRNRSRSKKSHKSDRKKSKKHKKDRKSKKKKKAKKHDKAAPRAVDQNAYGKYGILRESDFHQKAVSFKAWLRDVKKIADFNGPKWEAMEYFREYMEDYNTATLPHEKYYDLEKYELRQYQKKKLKASREQAQELLPTLRDEERVRQERRAAKEAKEREDFRLIMQTMDKDKIEAMREQERLRSQMQMHYKAGNVAEARRLEQLLNQKDDLPTR